VKPTIFLPIHSAELGRLPTQHFEITNPFALNSHFPPDHSALEGMDGWFQPQLDHDLLPEKVLPSDFFSSVLDNTQLGAAEGENPQWAYAPATEESWTNWDQYMQGGILDARHP